MKAHHHSIVEFITTQKVKPALFFNDSWFTLNQKMNSGGGYAADHNHPVDAVDCQVQAIRSENRKRAHEMITPITAIYNEHQNYQVS